jgi:hypothetical protein
MNSRRTLPHGPAAPNTRPQDILGYFDHASALTVRGWVCDRRDMAAAMQIDAVLDGEPVARIAADRPRDDLRAHGVGTGRYGFELDAESLRRDVGAMSDLSFYVAGTNLLLKPGSGGAIEASRAFRGSGPEAAAAFLASVADTMDVVVNIDHPHAMIGDTITALPFILHLRRLLRRPIHVTGAFGRPVRALLAPDMLIHDAAPGPLALRFNLGVGPARAAAAQLGLHASQGFFLLAGFAAPRLPATLDLVTEDCGLPPGIVIAPFAASERNIAGNRDRMWYPDRWRAVIDDLAGRGLGPVHVIGASADDFPAFDFPNVTHIKDRPLPQILDLMRRATLCVTVETGPAHLAHFGGVAKHVLIYGDTHPPALVATSLGMIVRGKVADLPITAVLAGIAEVLDR